MNTLSEVKTYARFGWGLRDFLRHTLTLEEAQAIVRQRLAERENNFLRLVERGIFGHPRSPYLPLLHWAGCEFGDIQNMVRSKGLEGTLRALREAGVYITFEEFKGRQPIVRSGQVIPVQAHDFDNPYLSHYYQAETGGSTGVGTRVTVDLDHVPAQAPHVLLTWAAHGVLDAPLALWRSILPAHTGIEDILEAARLGRVPQRWFSPVMRADLKPSWKHRLATDYVIAVGRLFGLPIPHPEPVPLDQAAVIARWVADVLKAEGTCLIRTGVSMALRVCIAAQEEGISLSGATFIGGAEPPTPAKVQGITDTGARYIPVYAISELGHVGVGCSRPTDCNDLHFLKDAVALIQHPSQVPGWEITVNAFHFTTLLPTAPKLMLNVESDDYGIVETRSCDCPLESYGFTEHLRQVRSFRKLTGEGMTLVGSEMIRILEEVLPSRFGGSPLDYQLVEEEEEQGFTRLNLLISPRVKIDDEEEVVEVVLQALGQGDGAMDLARAIWGQTKTLRVKRMEPIWTARGKLAPLHLIQHTERPSDTPVENAIGVKP